ncbi:hypothetical protein AB5J56_23205 [Streptomyces sp. R21]|uniref:Uncharacterized protein n=1 Tax=Streptomyces sp. R21 TaxID=3238627 RepID=A0AB39PEH8_9ACTN
MNLRLLALAGVVAATVALPLAVASAGPVSDGVPGAVRLRAGDLFAGGRVGDSRANDSRADGKSGAGASGRRSDDAGRSDDARTDGARSGGARSGGASRADGEERASESRRSSPLLGLGLATAANCGPELSSPDGLEAQTCVLTQGQDTWARTYYRNASGEELSSVLSLMKPDGRTLQMRCAVGAEDEPGACETPRERTTGDAGAYTAVAEFAKSAGSGPLLLRSGSSTSDAGNASDSHN